MNTTSMMQANYQDANRLTLTHAQAKALTIFCKRHHLTRIIVARNDGVYIGANAEGNRECVYFFPGCDPSANPHWQEVADATFGPDDFTEWLPLAAIADTVRLGCAGVRIHIDEDDVRVHYFLA